MNQDDVIKAGRELPERYADRVSPEVRDGMQLMRDGGEYGELVGLLTAALAKSGVPITAAERDELRQLAEATGEGGEYVDGLTVRD